MLAGELDSRGAYGLQKILLLNRQQTDLRGRGYRVLKVIVLLVQVTDDVIHFIIEPG